MKVIKESEFINEINKGLVLVDFYAEWCGPCKMLSPILEEIAEEYKGKLKVIKIDIDKNIEFANICYVKSVPTLFFISRNGNFQRIIGAQPKDVIINIIESNLLNE